MLETTGSCPEARGGCQLALHGDALFVVGGHSMIWEKGGETDRVHDDIWALDLGTSQVEISCMSYCHVALLLLLTACRWECREIMGGQEYESAVRQ